MVYPKDKANISAFINENRKKDVYHEKDMLDITRMFIKVSI